MPRPPLDLDAAVSEHDEKCVEHDAPPFCVDYVHPLVAGVRGAERRVPFGASRVSRREDGGVGVQ